MTDDNKALICFSSDYYEENIYLKLSPEYLNFLNFLAEKDLLNNNWEFENIKEIKVYEF